MWSFASFSRPTTLQPFKILPPSFSISEAVTSHSSAGTELGVAEGFDQGGFYLMCFFGRYDFPEESFKIAIMESPFTRCAPQLGSISLG